MSVLDDDMVDYCKVPWPDFKASNDAFIMLLLTINQVATL